MSEQTGIFLTNEEVLELADILNEYGFATNKDILSEYELATNNDWEDDGVMDKVFERAVEILIKNEKEQTK